MMNFSANSEFLDIERPSSLPPDRLFASPAPPALQSSPHLELSSMATVLKEAKDVKRLSPPKLLPISLQKSDKRGQSVFRNPFACKLTSSSSMPQRRPLSQLQEVQRHDMPWQIQQTSQTPSKLLLNERTRSRVSHQQHSESALVSLYTASPASSETPLGISEAPFSTSYGEISSLESNSLEPEKALPSDQSQRPNGSKNLSRATSTVTSGNYEWNNIFHPESFAPYAWQSQPPSQAMWRSPWANGIISRPPSSYTPLNWGRRIEPINLSNVRSNERPMHTVTSIEYDQHQQQEMRVTNLAPIRPKCVPMPADNLKQQEINILKRAPTRPERTATPFPAAIAQLMNSPAAELPRSPTPFVDDSAQLYVIERIVGHRFARSGDLKYLIKWKDYTSKHNCWIVNDQFSDAVGSIEEYIASGKMKLMKVKPGYETPTGSNASADEQTSPPKKRNLLKRSTRERKRR